MCTRSRNIVRRNVEATSGMNSHLLLPRYAANEILCRSDPAMHQYRSRDWLDVALPGAINRRGASVSSNAKRSVLDSVSVIIRTYIRRHHRSLRCGIPRHQDVSLVNGTAVDRRVDLRNLRQLRHVAVYLQDTFR